MPAGPFPDSPLQTGHATFTASGFPSVGQAQSSPCRLSFLCISPMFMRTSPLIGYLCSGNPDRLRPFAMWPALPASDYYSRSDAPQVSLPDCWEHPFQGSLSRS